jgi:GDP-L-fucose synthase
MHVSDMASACIFLMDSYSSGDIINIGTGEDISISAFAHQVADTIGFRGEIKWDTKKPNGTLKKLLDVSKLRSLGFKHRFTLAEGIKQTYEWFLLNYAK